MNIDNPVISKLVKYKDNPILRADRSLWWASQKIYNAGSFLYAGEYNLIFRAIGDDYISRLGRARSKDGNNFLIDPEPVFSPKHIWESNGCEDPRITKIDDTYWIAYTGFDGEAAHASLTSTKDFIHWSKRTKLFPNWREGRWVSPTQSVWSKAAALFPEKIGGQYYLFFGDDSIWPAMSGNLVDWEPSRKAVLEPRLGYFDESYVEMGPPPIRTNKGWLIIYHGIDKRDDSRVYRLGAALVDLKNPLKVLWRCEHPILEPSEKFERVGKIDIIKGGMERMKSVSNKELEQLNHEGKLPEAVFCCGTIQAGQYINVYYSGSDTVMCLAMGKVG